MNDLRKDRRAPSSLKVKYKSATVDEFIEQFGSDISRGGIFIKTKKPLDTGALLKFEFQLQGGAAVIHGVGRVAWRRAEERARADLPAGMGIKFIKLDDQSRAVIERVEARHGTSSRFEQTDAAELAPPLSSLPPTATLPGIATPPAPPPAPGNTNNSGARRPPPSPAAAIAKAPEPGGDKPTFRPPPPAMSSIPPALADAWPSTPPKPPAGRAAPAPRAALGSFSSDVPRRTAPSTRSTARDASEFLASAFSVGGAGHDVRSAARVQAERARRDPQSVDLANELFGDLNEAAPKPAPAANSADIHEVEHVDASMLDSLGPPSDPKPLTPQERTLADKIPSIEDLVNESGSASQAPQFQRDSSPGTTAARPTGTAQSALSSLPSPAGLPLSLALSNPPPTAAVDKGETLRPKANAAQRGPLGMLVGVGLFVVIAGGVFFLTRSMHHAPSHAESAAGNAPAAAANPQPSAATPAKPAEQNPAPAAATAVAAEAVPAVPVELSVTSEPRGAQLLADGKPAGTTPATLSLTAGVAVELSVHSPGYATTTQRVTPQKGMTPQHFLLAPLPYELMVTTEPAGANVHVKDLSAISPAPLTLGHLDGMVTATIDKDGYQRMSKTVRLEEFHEQGGTMRAEVSVTLSALPGGVRRRPPAVRAPAAPPPEPPSADAPPPVIQLKPAEPAANEPAAEKAPAPAPAPEAAAAAPKAEAAAPAAETPPAPTP